MAETIQTVEGNIGIGMTILVHCCFCEAQHSHQLNSDEKKVLDSKGQVTTGTKTANCFRGEYQVHIKK